MTVHDRAAMSPRHNGTRSSSIRSRVAPKPVTSSSSLRSFLLARTAKASWPERSYGAGGGGRGTFIVPMN